MRKKKNISKILVEPQEGTAEFLIPIISDEPMTKMWMNTIDNFQKPYWGW